MADFAFAVHAVRLGHSVSRTGWNGKGQFIQLIEPLADVTLPYIAITTVDGNSVPWVASQTDMLADDWRLHVELFDLLS